MCIRAVFPEVALCSLLIILADLGFVVVVWDVQHFVLHFQGQLLYSNLVNTLNLLNWLHMAHWLLQMTPDMIGDSIQLAR